VLTLGASTDLAAGDGHSIGTIQDATATTVKVNETAVSVTNGTSDFRCLAVGLNTITGWRLTPPETQ
jgi:hypothetical protein